MADSEEKCVVCGSIVYKFDPPIFIIADEACGARVNVYIQLKSPNDTSRLNAFFLQETCVGPKGHYPETDHYLLIESTYSWRTNEPEDKNTNSKTT